MDNWKFFWISFIAGAVTAFLVVVIRVAYRIWKG